MRDAVGRRIQEGDLIIGSGPNWRGLRFFLVTKRDGENIYIQNLRWNSEHHCWEEEGNPRKSQHKSSTIFIVADPTKDLERFE